MAKIGIIGSGFMAATHMDRYREIRDVHVTAIASVDGAETFTRRHDIDAATYEDAASLLDDAEVDAVDICTPTPTHPDLVALAADRGVDVFCEKPLANTIDGAETIVDAVEQAGITAMVGHVLRFFPEYRRVKAAVDGEGIGPIGVARARRLSPFPDWCWNDWYANESESGGVLLDLAIHDFDYLRWVVGDVERVFARERGDGPTNHAHAVLQFNTGATGYVETSWSLPPGSDLETELEIAGRDGLVELESADQRAVTIDAAGEAETVSNPVAKDGYQRELEAFVGCINNGQVPPVTVHDAYEALRIALAAKRSAERGEPVAVAEVGR